MYTSKKKYGLFKEVIQRMTSYVAVLSVSGQLATNTQSQFSVLSAKQNERLEETNSPQFSHSFRLQARVPEPFQNM